MKNTMLIFGYGYVGSFVADLLKTKGRNVIGTKRSPAPVSGIIPYERESVREALSEANSILVSIPPTPAGDVVLGDFADLICAAGHIEQIGYLSATSVYGNHNGASVDENTILKPVNDRARTRILAEKQWLEFGKKYNINIDIFRLAGIYGPGKNALEQVKAGQAKSIFKEGQVFSRINVVDIASIIMAAMERKDLGSQIYNLADDYPCSTIEVNNYAARLLQMESPPVIDFEEAILSEMAREFYMDNKRVDNAKVKELLHIKLKYPTYREGLSDLYKSL